MDFCPEQFVEQQVAEPLRRPIAAKHERTLETETRRRRRCLAHMIALRSAERDDVIAFLRQNIGKKKFELANFVAASGEPGLIVALHVNFGTAEMTREPFEFFDRR